MWSDISVSDISMSDISGSDISVTIMLIPVTHKLQPTDL